MKKILISSCSIFLILVVFISGCSSGKQVSTSKATLKSVSNLAYLTPQIWVEAIDKKSQKSDDVELAAKLVTKTSNISTSILKGKYQLVNTSFQVEKADSEKVGSFLDKLDAKDINIAEVEIPSWLNNPTKENNQRYFLATFVNGFYLSAFEPNYALKQALSSNTLVLNSPSFSSVTVKVLVGDWETNRILFYNTDKSTQMDPRLTGQVEEMVKKIIKPIYYK